MHFTRRSQRGRGALARIVAVVLLIFGSVKLNAPTHAHSLEYQVKASYLYNFLQFIKWPPGSFGEDGYFNLCVVEAARFGSALDAVEGERVQGRAIAVHRLEAVTEATGATCQLLFVAANPDEGPSEIPPQRGLLTVGETPGFLHHGGIINLINLDGRVRFEINQDAALAAGLVISSRLLALAVN